MNLPSSCRSSVRKAIPFWSKHRTTSCSATYSTRETRWCMGVIPLSAGRAPLNCSICLFNSAAGSGALVDSDEGSWARGGEDSEHPNNADRNMTPKAVANERLFICRPRDQENSRAGDRRRDVFFSFYCSPVLLLACSIFARYAGKNGPNGI